MSLTAHDAGRSDPSNRPAGIVTRLAAACADAGIVLVAVVVIYAVVAGARFVWSPRNFQWPEPSLWFSLIAAAVIAIAYLTAGWAITGRTLGKTLLGLRLLSRRGTLVGWIRAFVRAVLCVFFPIGLFWVIVSPNRRSVQDALLQTRVLYDWRNSPQPPPPAPATEPVRRPRRDRF